MNSGPIGDDFSLLLSKLHDFFMASFWAPNGQGNQFSVPLKKVVDVRGRCGEAAQLPLFFLPLFSFKCYFDCGTVGWKGRRTVFRLMPKTSSRPARLLCFFFPLFLLYQSPAKV